MFPFARFPGVDTLLGPEMRSTGEVMGLDRDYADRLRQEPARRRRPGPDLRHGLRLGARRRQAEDRRSGPASGQARASRSSPPAAPSASWPSEGVACSQDQQGAGRPAAHRRRYQERRGPARLQHHRRRAGARRQPVAPPRRPVAQGPLLHHHRRAVAASLGIEAYRSRQRLKSARCNPTSPRRPDRAPGYAFGNTSIGGAPAQNGVPPVMLLSSRPDRPGRAEWKG